MLWVIAGTFVGGYVLLCAALFAGQRSMLYPAPKLAREPGRSVTRVDVPGGGLFLYRAASTPDAPVLVHFHGNGEQAGTSEWLAQELSERGLGTALVEYPGYGLLAEQGSPTEASILEAADAAVKHLETSLGVAPSRIVLSGQSLGSGVAVELAKRGIGQRLLLLTPYTRLPDVAQAVLPFVPVGLLMLDRFDSASKAPEVKIPVLVIHGTADEVVPQRLGRELAGRFPSARFVSIEGGHHNDLWDRPEVLEQAAAFLAGR
jgi:alpha-beta hydrolase superfamily lysophospholipase